MPRVYVGLQTEWQWWYVKVSLDETLSQAERWTLGTCLSSCCGLRPQENMNVWNHAVIVEIFLSEPENSHPKIGPMTLAKDLDVLSKQEAELVSAHWLKIRELLKSWEVLWTPRESELHNDSHSCSFSRAPPGSFLHHLSLCVWTGERSHSIADEGPGA